MTDTDEVAGRLFLEFKAVHDRIRSDIARCRRLAADAAAGADASALRAGVDRLRSNGLLFQLRVNCLQACGFVHMHHRGEDAMLFPSVRAAAPELSAVVDKLEADHRVVSDLLDEVEDAAGAATGAAHDHKSRRRLVEALESLSRHLLDHLSYEEKMLAPVINRWKRWPFYG
ncbi:hemerythrin domain-containing protein [Planotetraspora kaengkrachanensis]|uniref:Hemerythrin-like domain-containing protein n=1 Tax=Planotetraspora kaengkrachanensis TaxID=575193 RepID=A0A8J3M1E1_9ACTN|nr:hemerythrin domain-containing protein [Planotetraspora kaengkrachanensis]GIG77589.1 hypothetical protein Pka01_07160 [Planotetraspora kaengkrachanensis]